MADLMGERLNEKKNERRSKIKLSSECAAQSRGSIAWNRNKTDPPGYLVVENSHVNPGGDDLTHRYIVRKSTAIGTGPVTYSRVKYAMQHVD